MKNSSMFDSALVDFRESIANIPPLMKLPTLLVLADEIKEALPAAEKEYAAEKERMTSEFIAVLRKYIYE